MDLQKAPVERILKKTRMRVSKDAVEEFAILLEEITADIAAEACAIAKRNNRKTVLKEDILEAKKKLE
ncbi:MAG: histone [Candidatus Aenigmatarchaeota archaeon]